MRLLPFSAITVLTRRCGISLLGAALAGLLSVASWAHAAENQQFDIPALMKGIPQGYFPPGIDKAAELVRGGDSERALALIEKTRKGWKRPQYPDRTLYLEALAELQLGKIAEAHETLKRSLKLRGSNSDALYLLGKTSSDSAEQLDAFTQAGLFNRFMSVQPNDAFIERVRILIANGDTVMATTILERSIAATPNFPFGRIELSTLYLASDKQPEAIKLLREGLSYDTANLDLKAALARTLLIGVQRSTDRPKIEEANTLAAEVYKARPSDVNAAMLYAKTLIEFSKPAEADAVVTAASKLFPTDEQLKRLRSQIELERRIEAQSSSSSEGAAKSDATSSSEPAPSGETGEGERDLTSE